MAKPKAWEVTDDFWSRVVMLTCVRWYVAYPLSLRHVEEMMQERGVFVDHSTVHRWATKVLSVLACVFRRRKRPVGGSWRMDETYIKVAGQWKYLYRAVDRGGDTVDFLLTARRDKAAARRFLERAKELSKDVLNPLRRGAVYKINEASACLVRLATAENSDSILPFSEIADHQIRNLIARTGKKCFPKLKKTVTPYCFRNQLASDLKASGYSKTSIALVLGHTSTLQQKKYGRPRYGNAQSAWKPEESHIIKSHLVEIKPDRFSDRIPLHKTTASFQTPMRPS